MCSLPGVGPGRENSLRRHGGSVSREYHRPTAPQWGARTTRGIALAQPLEGLIPLAGKSPTPLGNGTGCYPAGTLT